MATTSELIPLQRILEGWFSGGHPSRIKVKVSISNDNINKNNNNNNNYYYYYYYLSS